MTGDCGGDGEKDTPLIFIKEQQQNKIIIPLKASER
jgi:hypothetical protein